MNPKMRRFRSAFLFASVIAGEIRHVLLIIIRRKFLPCECGIRYSFNMYDFFRAEAYGQTGFFVKLLVIDDHR